MILFISGDDTQGRHLLSDALDAVSNKSVYMIGLGSEENKEVLNRRVEKERLTDCSNPNSRKAITILAMVKRLRTGFRKRPAQIRPKYFMTLPPQPTVPCPDAGSDWHDLQLLGRGSP